MEQNPLLLQAVLPQEVANTVELDAISETLFKLEGMAQSIKQARAELEQRMVEYIKAYGPFTIGDMKYWLANPPKTKCTSNLAVLENLLELTDVKRMAECLASDAWKHGTIKRLLAEFNAPAGLYDSMFVTTYDDKLEKKVCSADQRYLR